MMRYRYIILTVFFSLLLGAGSAFADSESDELDNILKGIESRYGGKGFKADFFQESMLKAMQISDTAEGRLTVKKPGKMRWEYTLPDPQTIISDGQSIWIHRPSDNQVMVGKAPEFFGSGNGAGFLSNIQQIRKSFHIKQKPAQNKDYLRLQLVPLKPTADIAKIMLSVKKTTYQVDYVVTYNAYGDETKITLSNYRFDVVPDDQLFQFEIPDGTDVIEIDQP